MTDVLLLAVIAYLSRPVVANLVSKNQVMNTSFDPFKLVNTYGAFGSVGEGRYEPVVALSEDGTTWREVDLPCKPTNLKRRPCFSASPCGNHMFSTAASLPNICAHRRALPLPLGLEYLVYWV